MSFTVRAPIKSSNSILMPNWRSAASMMMGRRLDSYRKILPEIHIGLYLLPLESCCIHDDSNKPLHKILALNRLTGAGDACPTLSVEGPTVLVGVGKLVPPCAAIILERLWAMSFTVRHLLILKFDTDAELAFRSIHDDGKTAGSYRKILPEIHIGLYLLPLESCCIHDDSNKPSIRSGSQTASQMAEDTSPIGVLRPDAGTFLNAASEINLASLSTFRCPGRRAAQEQSYRSGPLRRKGTSGCMPLQEGCLR